MFATKDSTHGDYDEEEEVGGLDGEETDDGGESGGWKTMAWRMKMDTQYRSP